MTMLEVLWARLCRWTYDNLDMAGWALHHWAEAKFVETLYWLDRIAPGWDDRK